MVKQAYSDRQKHLKLYLLKPLRVEGHLNLQNKNIYKYMIFCNPKGIQIITNLNTF